MSSPNSWAQAAVKNDWGSMISNVTLKHRYDNDHYDEQSWLSVNNGKTTDTFKVGFWTGFGRTGYDYWLISFEVDGKVWTCKDNFYCFLTHEDINGTVICRIYKDGNEGKMEVICPKSSNCIVSLHSEVATPNSWAKATVYNEWEDTVFNVQLNHRYDKDHYDAKFWSSIDNRKTGETFEVGFWTGFGRTGYDYWLISFEADGKVWTCKDNFYCFLTHEDVNGTVICRIYKDGNEGKMEIICPKSSNCTVSLTSQPKPLSNTRPVYIIGHRCNDPGDIGLAISSGCNAIECDLQYNSTSQEVFVNHDFESGTNFYEWLNNAKMIMKLYPSRFSLIVFDCKFAASLDSSTAAHVFSIIRQDIRNYLNAREDVPINVLFSMAHYDNRAGFNNIMNDLLPNEGISIDECDKPDEVEKFFSNNFVENCWYGNGIFTLGPKDVYPYVKSGCELRDKNKKLKKVYVWTLAKEKSIKKYILEAQIDAVMVNVPDTIAGIALTGLTEALTVINNSSVAHLANRKNLAFAVYNRVVPE